MSKNRKIYIFECFFFAAVFPLLGLTDESSISLFKYLYLDGFMPVFSLTESIQARISIIIIIDVLASLALILIVLVPFKRRSYQALVMLIFSQAFVLFILAGAYFSDRWDAVSKILILLVVVLFSVNSICETLKSNHDGE